MSLEAGMSPIPGYRLTQPLGAGAFGDVWEARRDTDGRVFALKFMDCRSQAGTLASGEVRVLRALSQVRHPNIIQLHGVHALGRYLILVMERADCNLADLHEAYRTETKGNIPPDHALDLLGQAAVALDFLATTRLEGFPTSRGLQHCDVKPSNLLLVGTTLKVGDFGLCSGTGWVTHSGGWKGTLPYAAPELFKGAAAPGTDQFALAVTFCEMVMGNRPFFKDTNPSASPTGLPIDLTKLRESEFPIIARALHTFPSSRWPSCTAFIDALKSASKSPRTEQSVRIFPRGTRGTLRHSGVRRRLAALSAQQDK